MKSVIFKSTKTILDFRLPLVAEMLFIVKEVERMNKYTRSNILASF